MSLPAQLSKENRKFIYKVVKTGARSKDYEDVLLWLEDAGMIYRVYGFSMLNLQFNGGLLSSPAPLAGWFDKLWQLIKTE